MPEIAIFLFFVSGFLGSGFLLSGLGDMGSFAGAAGSSVFIRLMIRSSSSLSGAICATILDLFGCRFGNSRVFVLGPVRCIFLFRTKILRSAVSSAGISALLLSALPVSPLPLAASLPGAFG